MTIFDEEKLQRALRESANGFAVSDDAMTKILDEARELPAPVKQRRLHEFVERTGRVRSSVMAAAACAVVLAVAVPLISAESPALNSAAGAHRSSVHANALKVAVPGATQTVTGTGFTSGVVLPQSEAQSLVTNGAVATTSAPTLSLSGLSTKSTSSASAQEGQSSLRVEEIGTIQLSVGSSKFQSTLTQLTDFATTDGGFVQ